MSRAKFDLEIILEAEALAAEAVERWSEAEMIEDPQERGVASEKIRREFRDHWLEIKNRKRSGG